MEVPEFCTQPRARLVEVGMGVTLRKRKTQEEIDPDYAPGETGPSPNVTEVNKVTTMKTRVSEGENEEPLAEAGPSTASNGASASKKPWDLRRVIQRSKKLAFEETMIVRPINIIDRKEYTIEDSKVKAAEARKKREELKKMKPKLKKGMKAKKGRGRRGMGGDEDDEDEEEDNFDYQLLGPILGDMDPITQSLDKMVLDTSNFSLDNLPKFVMGTGKGEKGGPPAFEYQSLWNYELMPLNLNDDGTKDNHPWNKWHPNDPKPTPDVLSIVACFSVGIDLDLRMIAEANRNLEYNPDRFAPLIMRVRDPKTTALIFGTGKVIVTGAKSEEFCRVAARKYARTIQRAGYTSVKVIGLEIQNISAHCGLNFKVRLNQLSKNRLYGHLSYEPELFPGLIIPLEYPKVKVIVFCTGSLLMTGAKSEKDLKEAYIAIYPLLRMYAH